MGGTDHTPTPRTRRDSTVTPSTPRTPKKSGVQTRPSEPPTRRQDVFAPIPFPGEPEDDAPDPRVAAMRELYAAGDADAALFIAMTIDATQEERPFGDIDTPPPAPPRHAPVDATRAGFVGHLAAATSHAVPHIVLAPRDLAALPLDHRAGFLLAHIDGMSTMDEILDICAMPESEAIFLLRQLLAMGVVAFGPPRAIPR